MEPGLSSVSVAQESLSQDGFIVWQDAALGDDISELERRDFPFATEEGLDFCKHHVLYDPRVRPILESAFGTRCVLVHWMRYMAAPGRTISFRGGGTKVLRPRFMVQLLSKGSQIAYCRGSHLVDLPVEVNEHLIFETPKPDLDRAGFAGKDYDFVSGGMFMLDARLKMEIKQGFAITFVFATEDVLVKWPPMFLPNVPALRRKVADELASDRIGVNFAFTDNDDDTHHTSNHPSRVAMCETCRCQGLEDMACPTCDRPAKRSIRS